MSNTVKTYSLSKSRHIMKSSNKWYKKRGKGLPSDQLKFFEDHLQALDKALLDKDQTAADKEAHIVDEFCSGHFKKTIWEYGWEIIIAVLVALIIATVVRQMWFELYEIPTGSMRPTFKEQDHLTVTKTAFGINVPLKTEHFYFDPALVQRTSVVIWSGDNVPHLDSESTFMNIFPYTKRFIKRNMGKPGDTLYFYGGKIYGFDKEGNDLKELRESPYLTKLDHIPFTHFEGRHSYVENPKNKSIDQVIFYLMNQPLGRIRFLKNEMKGEVLNGQDWVQDNPEEQLKPHDSIKTYSDFWGIRNYAMARLLTKKEAEKIHPSLAKDLDETPLYLELRHTPSLNVPEPLLSNQYGVRMTGFTTLIPLQEKHLKSIMANMYTCRFEVKGGKALPYRLEGNNNGVFRTTSPSFPNVPDGNYEFYYGKAYKLGFGAIETELPSDHPLYKLDPENVQKLFNVGIEMSTLVEPKNSQQAIFPNRYAYFREGALYVMGGPIMEKDDPLLQAFNQKEKQREGSATTRSPYIAFKDYGPPFTTEGVLDKDFIKTFGYHVPEGKYLMLGDNHAMSQDSRWFGPIPQANLQGAPSLIIWPPGPRLGAPLQKPYPILVLPRLIVWTIAGVIFLIWWILHRRKLKRPMFKKIDFKN
jgi:signal peptidase I